MQVCHCKSPLHMVGQQLFGMVCPQLIFLFIFLSLLPKYLGIVSNTANELQAHAGNCLREYTMSVQLSQLLIYLLSFVLSCQGQLLQRTVFHKNQWLKGAWRSCQVPCDEELGCLPVHYLLAGCAVKVTQPGFALFFQGGGIENQEGKRQPGKSRYKCRKGGGRERCFFRLSRFSCVLFSGASVQVCGVKGCRVGRLVSRSLFHSWFVQQGAVAPCIGKCAFKPVTRRQN